MTCAQVDVPGIAGDAPRRATVIAVTVLCLLLAVKVIEAYGPDWPTQVPWVVALFVVPLLYAFPGTRRRLARYRWPVLAVQALLTWLPFAVFGGRWEAGMGGLLAGLVLLTVAAPVSWLLVGALLAGDVAVRAAVVGLPSYLPRLWPALVWVVVVFVDVALAFFGIVRLAQIVVELQQAQGEAAALAVARERLLAAGALQAAIGERLAGILTMAAASRRALSGDVARARAQIAAAGVTAREAVAQARAVTSVHRDPPRLEPAPEVTRGAVVGARLAWVVLVVELSAFGVQGVNNAVAEGDGPRLTALVTAGIAAGMALQLYHSWSARTGGKPRAWPVTLGLQAVLAYVFFLLPGAADVVVVAPFLAGSVLLLVPGWWRWAGYATVVASWPILYATVPLPGVTPADRTALSLLYLTAIIAGAGLLVYGLSRLPDMARRLAAVRGELARMAVLRERLRVARDAHDLLGLGLSAIALKADLIGALIGRDNARAATEIGEMGRICAASRADVRLVTGDGRLSLADELAAAKQILASAGIQVDAEVGPVPASADEVLGPVMREAVTNIVRHAAATACTIDVTTSAGTVRLHIGNDGVPEQPARSQPPAAGAGAWPT